MPAKTTIYMEDVNAARIDETASEWKAQFPGGGILAFVSEHSSQAVELLQQASKKLSYPLVGAVFPELISDNSLKRNGVILVCFSEMPATCIISMSAEKELQNLAKEISSCINVDMDEGDQSLFMIFDAMIPNISSIIDQLYLETGDVVNYMGVNAGSETFQPIDCLFDENQFVGNAVLAMAIKHHQGAIVEHGYTKPDTTISATSTTGNRISSIDWRPAFEVYQELASTHYGIDVNKDNFYETAAHFPFGIMRMDGEMLVRIPVAMEDDGSIFCVGEVPENAMLTLLKAVPENSPETVNTIAQRIAANDEENIITFYCAGRRMHLGEAAQSEIRLLSEKLHDKNIVGALSLGEIGGSKQGGYPLFHNAALVNIPIR